MVEFVLSQYTAFTVYLVSDFLLQYSVDGSVSCHILSEMIVCEGLHIAKLTPKSYMCDRVVFYPVSKTIHFMIMSYRNELNSQVHNSVHHVISRAATNARSTSMREVVSKQAFTTASLTVREV